MAKADKTSNESQSQRSTLAAQHRKVIGEQQRHQDIDRTAKDRKLRTSSRSRSFKQARSGGGARQDFTTWGLYATVLSGIVVCAAFLYWTVVLATPQEQGA